MSRHPAMHLTEALAHLSALHDHLVRHDVDDELVVDACALRLSAAIEAVGRLPRATIHEFIDEGTWRAIKGMRNRIAHAYAFVDPVVVRRTLQEDVAPFRESVQRMLDDLGPEAS